MKLRVPSRDEPPDPLHLGIMFAQPRLSQHQWKPRRTHDQEDHLLLVIPRNANLDRFGRSHNFGQ